MSNAMAGSLGGKTPEEDANVTVTGKGAQKLLRFASFGKRVFDMLEGNAEFELIEKLIEEFKLREDV